MIPSQVKAPWPGWEVLECLGGGSFGAVYKIRRVISDVAEYAAMKVIPVPREQGEGQDLLDRGYDLYSVNQRYKDDLDYIRKEYSIMALLKGNANVVYCDDICDQPNPDGIGWILYIRMELLTPLKKALTEICSEAQVIKVGMDLCNALTACKRKNIIHRDIKPENIMVAEDGNCKLGDFGVAKIQEGTSAGTKTGTFNYMAPEIYNNRPNGPSSDIYSLGMVMYWMLNRRCGPFLPLPPSVPTASQMDSARDRRFSGEVLPPPVDGSQALHKIVLRACAYDPAQRYSTPEEMYAAIAALSPVDQGRTELNFTRTELDFTRTEMAFTGGGTVATDARRTADSTQQTSRGSSSGKRDPNDWKTEYEKTQGSVYSGAVQGGTVGTENRSREKTSAQTDPKGVFMVESEIVISSAVAKSGGPRMIKDKNGKERTIQIPTGCKDKQIVNGTRVYVHDFSTKTKNMEKLPTAVLEMYASKSNGLLGGILFAFLLWIAIGMATMLIPLMAIGLNVHCIYAIIRGVRKAGVINLAKQELAKRNKKSTPASR